MARSCNANTPADFDTNANANTKSDAFSFSHTYGSALCANISETTLLRKLVYNIGAEEIRR